MKLRIRSVDYQRQLTIDAEIWNVGADDSAMLNGMLAYLVAFAGHYGIRVGDRLDLEDTKAPPDHRHACRLGGGRNGTLHLRAESQRGNSETALRDFLSRIEALIEAHGQNGITFAKYVKRANGGTP